MDEANEIMETSNRTPIEIALKIDDEGFTTARKLYEWLELDDSNYTRWLKSNIVDNPYTEDGFDYSSLMTKNNGRGRPMQDCKISASLAKKLAMASRSDRGEEARDYFIGCEQALKRVAEQKRQTELERAKGIAVRQALTKAIQQSGENERMHKHAYSTYTDLVYRTALGKSTKQLREEYGISKQVSLRDLFTEEELARVETIERLVSSLVDLGYGYDEVKEYIAAPVKRLRDRAELAG